MANMDFENLIDKDLLSKFKSNFNLEISKLFVKQSDINYANKSDIQEIINSYPLGTGGGSGIGGGAMSSIVVIKTDDNSLIGQDLKIKNNIGEVIASVDSKGIALFNNVTLFGRIQILYNDNQIGTLDISSFGYYVRNVSSNFSLVNISVLDNEICGQNINVLDSNHNVIQTLTVDIDGNAELYLYEQGIYYLKEQALINNKHVYKKIVINNLGENKTAKLFLYNIYSYIIKENDQTPETRVEPYESIYGCDNKNFTPMHMDYSNDVMDYGSWTGNEFFFGKPCMLYSSRDVAWYIKPDDYTQKLDSEEDSQNTNANFDGNCMIEFKTMWCKRHQLSNKRYFLLSDKKLDDDFTAYPFYTDDNKVADFVYASSYDGTVINSKMRSISGYAPTTNTTRQQEINYAIANGETWNQKSKGLYDLLCDIAILLSMTTDSKTAFGQGNNTGNDTGVLKTGTMDKKGLFYGSTNTKVCMKFMGIENFYGNIWKHLLGLINNKGTILTKMCRGTLDGSTTASYNLTGSGYNTVLDATPQGAAYGYVNGVKYNKDNGYIAYKASGTATTYETHGLLFNNSQVDYACVGGGSSSGDLVGVGCVNLNNLASVDTWSFGSSLECLSPTDNDYEQYDYE